MDLLSGFISSSISVYVVQPLDTIKVQLQTSLLTDKRKYIPQLAFNIYKNQGIKGFYRGSLSMISTYPFYWSVFFQMRGMKIISMDNEFIDNIINTSIASSVASIIANPLFVLKIRRQTDLLNNRDPTGYLKKIYNIYSIEGINGFFKGINATLLSNSKLILQFPLYDHILYQIISTNKSSHIPSLEPGNCIIIASFMSKLIANSIFYPTDIIRTIQRDNIEKKSMISIITKMYNSQGVRGFYRGIMIYNMVSCPNFVIMMLVKEQLDKLLSNSYK